MNDAGDLLMPQRVRTMQIITCALLMGVLVFLAISLYMVLVAKLGRGIPGQALPVLTLVAVVMLAGSAPLSFLIPGILARSSLQRIAAGTWQTPLGADPQQFASVPAKLMAVRQTTWLIGMALLEGTAFMGNIALLMEGQLPALGVVGVAICLMLLRFPTQGQAQAWLERQTIQLEEIQQRNELTKEP